MDIGTLKYVTLWYLFLYILFYFFTFQTFAAILSIRLVVRLVVRLSSLTFLFSPKSENSRIRGSEITERLRHLLVE